MISMLSSSSWRTVSIYRSALAFARDARTGVRRMRRLSLVNTASNMLELAVAVSGHEPELGCAVAARPSLGCEHHCIRASR